MTEALDIENLCYGYRSQWTLTRRPCLHGISLKVGAGESFGFLGPNGAGKTTTIKCILGLIAPTSGSVRIFGRSSLESGSRTRVGYLPEQPYFYDYLTVKETLELYGSLSGIARPQLSEAVSSALRLVGLSGRADFRMRELSKGLVQRAALAQAVIAKPQLLILDEPFSGLDPLGRREFREIFLDLKRDGATLFMSSHVLSDVEFICDRASIMAEGRIQGVFDLREVRTAEKERFELCISIPDDKCAALAAAAAKHSRQGGALRLELNGRAAADAALRKALELGAVIHEFGAVDGGLEKLFLDTIEKSRSGK